MDVTPGADGTSGAPPPGSGHDVEHEGSNFGHGAKATNGLCDHFSFADRIEEHAKEADASDDGLDNEHSEEELVPVLGHEFYT